jgi:hypothetical protein
MKPALTTSAVDTYASTNFPRAILSGNASPFGSPGLARLSRLSLWWSRLGIRVERIVPAHPKQNGELERMLTAAQGKSSLGSGRKSARFA